MFFGDGIAQPLVSTFTAKLDSTFCLKNDTDVAHYNFHAH